MRTIKFLLAIFILSFSFGSFAQHSGKKYFITGQVFDMAKQPVPNASVFVDNKSTDVVTDKNGNYKIKVKPTAKVLSIITLSSGLLSEEINGRDVINFQFNDTIAHSGTAQQVNTDNEEVNIGYGTAKKSVMATKVSTIDGKKNKYASYQDVYELIRGEVPGVQVQGDKIRVRGVGTFTGLTDPLILIDGIETKAENLANVDPRMVKSISILSGPDASIYGSKAANGVIMITLIGK